MCARAALVVSSVVATLAVTGVLSSCASDEGAVKETPASSSEASSEGAPSTSAGHREGAHEARGDGAHGDGAHEDGAHGNHRFEDAEHYAARFEDPARDAWQKPDAVIAALALTPSSKVADIGAATGYFPVRIARHVQSGIVYAVDVEESMTRYLTERAAREGLRNVQPILGVDDDPRLPEPVDVILLVNTYHHIASREAYFARLKRFIRPGGRVVVVDFKMGDLPVGPKDEMKVAPEQIAMEMGRAGYAMTRDDRETLPHQVILVFTPRS